MNWIRNQFDSRNKNRLERTRISVNMSRAAEWKKQVEAKGGSIYYINDKEVTKQTADYKRFKSIVESSLLLQQSEDRRNKRNRSDQNNQIDNDQTDNDQTDNDQNHHNESIRTEHPSLPSHQAHTSSHPPSPQLSNRSSSPTPTDHHHYDHRINCIFKMPTNAGIGPPLKKPRSSDQSISSPFTKPPILNQFLNQSPDQSHDENRAPLIEPPKKPDHRIGSSPSKPRNSDLRGSSSSTLPKSPDHINVSSFLTTRSHGLSDSSPFLTVGSPDQTSSSPFAAPSSPEPILSSSFPMPMSPDQSGVYSCSKPKKGYFW